MISMVPMNASNIRTEVIKMAVAPDIVLNKNAIHVTTNPSIIRKVRINLARRRLERDNPKRPVKYHTGITVAVNGPP